MIENGKKLKLTDLIDVEFLQEFQDFFAKTMGVASIAVDDVGPITKPSNFTDFCIKYTRSSKIGYNRCNQCDIKWGKIAAKSKKPVIYDCHTGLTDFAVPIFVAGQHVASILGGQVLTEPPNEEHFRKLAKTFGLNEDEYINEVKKIKIIPREMVEASANFLFLVANAISKIGHKNYELLKKTKREDLYKRITETIRSSLDIHKTKQKIVEIIGTTLNADRCFIMEYDKENAKFALVSDEYLSSDKITPYIGADTNVDIPNFIEEFKKGHYLIVDRKKIYIDGKPKNFSTEKETIEKVEVISAYGIPLFYKEELLGILGVHYLNNEHKVNEEEINLLKILADQIAISLHQANLLQVTKIQAERETLLRNINENIRSSLDLDETLTYICSESAKLFNIQRSAIAVFPDTETYKEFIIKKEYKTSPDLKGLVINNELHSKMASYWGKSLLDSGKVLAIDNIDESDTPDYFKEAYKLMGVKSVIGIPIKKGKKIWGTLVLSEYYRYRNWSEDEKILLKTIADQIYIAIHQAELFEKQKETAKRETLLRKIIETLRSSLDIKEVKKKITYELGTIFKADRCYFRSFDTKTDKFLAPDVEYIASDEIKSLIGVEPDQEGLRYFADKVIKENKKFYPIVVTKESSVGTPLENYINAANLKADYAIPIVTREDELIWLVLHYAKEDPKLDEDNKKLLETIAYQIDIAFEQIRLYSNIKKTAERELLLRKVIEAIRSSISIDETLTTICDEVARLFKVQRATIVNFYDPDNYKNWRILREFKERDDIKGLKDVPYTKEAGEYNGLKILNEGRNLVINNLEESSTPDYYKSTYQELGVKSILSVPIKKGNDKFGIIFLSCVDEYRTWEKEEIELLESIASQIYVAIKQAQIYEELKQSTAKQNAILNNMPFMAWLKDTNSKLLAVNKEYALKCNTTIENIIGKTDFDFFPQKQAELFTKEDKMVMELKQPISNIELITGDGGIRWHETFKSPVISEDGEIIGTTGVSRDITEKKQAEMELLRQQQEIIKAAQREHLLRKILETMRSTLDLNTIKNTIVNEVGKNLNGDICFILIYDSVNDYFYVDRHSEYKSSEEEKSFVDANDKDIKFRTFINMFKDKVEITFTKVEEFISEHNLQNSPEDYFLKDYNIKSCYCFAIYYAGEMLGYIVLNYTKDYIELDENNLEFLKTIAAQAGTAIYQANLYKITQVQAEREKISRNIIEILRSTLDKSIIKRLFVKNIGKFFNADRVLFSSYNYKTNTYLPTGSDSEYLSNPSEKSFVGYDWSTPEASEYIQPLLEKREFHIYNWEEYISNNYKSQEFIDLCTGANVKSSYNFPVLYQQKVLGFFSIEFTQKTNKLSNEDINRIRNICTQAGIALYHADLYEEAKKNAQAHEKFVTQLSNELKDPLNMIIEFSEVLSKSEHERSEELEYLRTIYENAKKLRYLLDDAVENAHSQIDFD